MRFFHSIIAAATVASEISVKLLERIDAKKVFAYCSILANHWPNRSNAYQPKG
jgi:hypothetical protein